MDQHPLPRQITSFEFKLVGFMTLHQFIYLLVFVPLGFAMYNIIPIAFVNVLVGFIIASIGVLLAFLPVNDRPLDVFLKNLYKRLTSPTQYLYKKSNQPISFLDNMQASTNPDKATVHVESQEKLSRYLQSKSDQASSEQANSQAADGVKSALNEPLQEAKATDLPTELLEKTAENLNEQTSSVDSVGTGSLGGHKSDEHRPFFIGMVKNNKDKPLPEILVYLRDESNTPVRLLKTNPNGVFATYSSLPQGEYLMEAKDPRGSYLFDTMKVRLSASNPAPFMMLSKGIL